MSHTLLPTEKLTPFIWRRRVEEGGAYYYHWCPGCKHAHSYRVGVGDSRPNWSFDGNIERPTFGPSMLIYTGDYTDEDGTHFPRKTRCHYFLQNGVLNFCSDSPHEFSGKQGIALEPIPDDYHI